MGTRIASRNARNTLKNLHPKIIFDLTGNIASASLIASSKAKEIVGMNTKYYKSIYDVYIPIRQKPHLIDRYLDVVNAYLTLDENKIIKEFPIKFQTDGKILIDPFAIRKAKEWNLRKYIALAIQLNKNYEVEIITPHNFISDAIKEEIIKNSINICVTRTLAELISKIKEGSVYISNDTGPLYIANLLGIATFTIYGPTNPEYSLPFGNNHKFIRKKIKCSPVNDQVCYTLAGIYCAHYECMNQLTVDEVYKSLASFLENLNIMKHNSIDAFLT